MNPARATAGLWLPIALLVVAQVFLAVRDDSPLPRGALSGTDGYMRLVRVEALYETGDWYDGVVHRSNAPYGESLHWTRPFDVVLLAGAAALAPLLGIKAALYWWGVLVSPVLHLLALFALLWAARPLFGHQALVYLGVLVVVQPAILFFFAVARPDHHGLIGLLFVVLLGFTLRFLARPFAARTAAAAGATAAALLWVGVEGLAAVAFALAALGLGWVAAGKDFASKGLVFSAALTAGLAAALALERPWGELGAEVYDRLSVVHVAVFAAVTAFWMAARALERGTALCVSAAGRAAAGLAGAAAVAGAVWLAFPRFFGGPMVDIDPRVIALWIEAVGEFRPLITAGNPVGSLREVVFFLGPAVLAVPFLFRLLGRRGDAGERRAWMGVALGLAVFVPLALYQRRWAPYAEFLVVLPYAALMMRALGALDAWATGGAARPAAMASGRQTARAAARALVVVGFATGFLLLAVLIFRLDPGAGAARPDCPITAMARHLAGAYRDAPKRILGFIEFGPEILYRTPHEVVATPYHRNTAGLVDAHDVLAATDDRDARGIVERRGVDLVLVCRWNDEAARYRRPGQGGAATLYQRLERGEPPGWLRRVALPADLDGAFGLFEVIE